jgi:hypothetical protein
MTCNGVDYHEFDAVVAGGTYEIGIINTYADTGKVSGHAVIFTPTGGEPCELVNRLGLDEAKSFAQHHHDRRRATDAEAA